MIIAAIVGIIVNKHVTDNVGCADAVTAGTEIQELIIKNSYGGSDGNVLTKSYNGALGNRELVTVKKNNKEVERRLIEGGNVYSLGRAVMLTAFVEVYLAALGNLYVTLAVSVKTDTYDSTRGSCDLAGACKILGKVEEMHAFFKTGKG